MTRNSSKFGLKYLQAHNLGSVKASVMVLPHPLQGVVTDAEKDQVCPIRYLHNPLVSDPPYIRQCHLAFPRDDPEAQNPRRVFNSFNPFNGNLPYCSSIFNVYESRFWREGMDAARTTIYLMSTENDAYGVPVQKGMTIQEIARRELRAGFKHRVLRCPAYMYPFSVDARRFEIIAVFACMLFLFDG